MDREAKKATKNTSMLYVLNIAKMIFPLATLPYLTRILTVDSYAVVAYVKAVMQYVQVVLVFGFTLSATKDIVNAKGDKKEIGKIVGGVLEAKLILSFITAISLVGITIAIPILREYPLYVALSFINAVLMEMLVDFLFRGMDRMGVITIRFVVAKAISTILTFILINDDTDLLLIPILDIVGSLVALALVAYEIKKLDIKIEFVRFKTALYHLKESAVYFISEMATTAFGALNTLLIGIFVTKTQVSYWSNCMQLIVAVQSLYSPITGGIYPSMVRTKSIGFIKKVLKIFMPIVIVGCIVCFFFSELFMTLIFGQQYAPASPVFRALVPVLLFSFPGMLFGWPTLGPIGKQKETTTTTIITAIVQVIGLILLLVFNKFDLIYIAVLRCITELLMLFLRARYCYIYRSLFNE